ncbi:MAG: CbrC family protein [Phycisphaerales bacterium]
MDPLPTFALFPDPQRENVYQKSSETCGVCKQARGVLYIGPKYGLSPVSDLAVCPWCIASGEAGKLGIEFNDVSVYTPPPDQERLNAEDRDLVAHRTPGYVTWQGNHWAMCCGRACIYLGEADAVDLQGRWAEAVASMFADQKWKPERIADTVNNICRGESPAAYVFQCQVCRKLQGYWDLD